jgi:AbrB family looped-hinge helix DNA binding protein
MLEYRTIISKGGRLVIPAIIRKKFFLQDGDELIIRFDEKGIHLFSLDLAVKNAQALVRSYNKENKKLTKILEDFRKEEMDA